MKFDFFTPSQLPYPGMHPNANGSCPQLVVAPGAGGGFQSPTRDGLFNSIFTPEDLPYPFPVIPTGNNLCPANTGTTPAPATGGDTKPTTPAAPPSSEPATLPSQIIINVAAPPAAPAAAPTSAPASVPTSEPGPAAAPTAVPAPAPAAQSTPVCAAPISTMRTNDTPPPATDTIVKLYAHNPRLRARIPKAQEQLLEEFLEEQITMRMLSSSGAPVTFAVPDGYNAVDFYIGAIEVNPNVGKAEDLDLIVTLGDVKLSENALPGNGPLKAGDQITVTVPWRYASWVELASGSASPAPRCSSVAMPTTGATTSKPWHASSRARPMATAKLSGSPSPGLYAIARAIAVSRS